MRQPHLPGHEPAYIRMDVTRKPSGGYDVRYYSADGPGFISVHDSDLYEDLVSYEVLDVVDVLLSTSLGT